jgi:uncharacterized membrane protein YozB (DUF420 family)
VIKEVRFIGFLGTGAGQFADIVLIAQTIGYLLLVLGVWFAKRLDFNKHIRMAQFAVSLGLMSLLWMFYSLLLGYQSFLLSSGLLVIIHIVAGILTLLAGVLFVFNKFINKTRVPMRIVFILWTISWIMGVFLYYLMYYNK